MKKAIALLTAVLMCMPVMTVITAFALDAKSDENREDIVILYTNDVHCGVNDYIGYDGLALYKKEMEKTHDNVLLVDAGDAAQGDLIGSLSKGEDVIKIINTLDYDVSSLGNHEFDYGLDQLNKLSCEINCGYICCNFYDKTTDKLVYEPYRIFNAGEKKIAFIGAVTPHTFMDCAPAYFKNDKGEFIYSFSQDGDELYNEIQKMLMKRKPMVRI